jgi:disulfide oxidoreductase YuzD
MLFPSQTGPAKRRQKQSSINFPPSTPTISSYKEVAHKKLEEISLIIIRLISINVRFVRHRSPLCIVNVSVSYVSFAHLSGTIQKRFSNSFEVKKISIDKTNAHHTEIYHKHIEKQDILYSNVIHILRKRARGFLMSGVFGFSHRPVLITVC